MSLQRTTTYYQDDSDGKFKGIEYFNLILLCVGAFISVGLTVILFVMGYDFFGSLWFSGIPFVLTLLWVLCLRHNRPKSYDVDFVQSLFRDGWEEEQSIPHPLESEELP